MIVPRVKSIKDEYNKLAISTVIEEVKKNINNSY